MKRVLLLVPFILILVAGLCTPVSQGGVSELYLQQQFIDSIDGASVTYTFVQSTTGDIMRPLDTFYYTSFAGSAKDTSYYTYLKTLVQDGTYYESDGYPSSSQQWIILNFSLPEYTVDGFDLSAYYFCSRVGATGAVQVQDGGTWTNVTTLAYSGGTSLSAGYDFSTSPTGSQMALRFIMDGSPSVTFGVDYAAVAYNTTDGFRDEFVDTYDWVQDIGNAPSSNNDLMTWAIPGDDAYDSTYTNAPNIEAGWYYCDVGGLANVTGGRIILYAYPSDDKGGTVILVGTFWVSTSFTATHFGFNAPDGVESFRFYAKNTANTLFQIDYLLVSPSHELGWSYDCSTSGGITRNGAVSVYSDGSNLNASITSGQDYFYLATDATASVAKIDPDYYPFLHIRFSSASVGNGKFALYSYDGSLDLLQVDSIISEQDYYYNLRAVTSSDIYRFYFYVFSGYSYEIEYIQIYGIANYTLSQGGVDADEAAYVSGSTLHFPDLESGEWMNFNHDPAIAQDPISKQVWNLTVDDITYFAWRFSEASVSWHDKVQAQSRGDWDEATNNIVDFSIEIEDGGGSISAITFIEDSTSPSVVRSAVSPDPPDDDESVTLSAVATDTVEVYTVTFNAITSPSGFSDVDYVATEISSNLWTYTFSSGDLPNGYYCFSVIANDGANENTLTTAQEFVDFTVRESEITATTETLFGAGDDFDFMTWTFTINKDCSYVINEWSDSNPAADTHSGAVAAGTRNIAWPKLDTTDTKVNFTVTFTNSTLSYVFESSYEVAQTALAINSYDWGWTETQVFVNYDMSKGGTYTTYVDDVQQSTDSFASGSNFLNFSRSGAVDPQEVDYAVKLTDSITTLWLNQSVDQFSLTAFSLSTFILDTSGANVTCIVVTPWDNATISLYQDGVLKASGAEGTTVAYAKSTTAGTYVVDVLINGTADHIWYNDTTYTVTYSYAWYFIEYSDQGGNTLTIDLDTYVNGSLIHDAAGTNLRFYGRTDQVYNITVLDRFGDSLYSSIPTVPADYEYDITINVYSFKVHSLMLGDFDLYVHSSGGGSQNVVLFHGETEEFWLYGGSSYYLTWEYVSGSNIGLWGQGMHYWPSSDDTTYRTPPTTSEYYTPSQADGIHIDEYDLEWVKMSILAGSNGGGGGSDFNASAVASALVTPVADAVIDVMTIPFLLTGGGVAATLFGLWFLYTSVQTIKQTMEQSKKEERPKPNDGNEEQRSGKVQGRMSSRDSKGRFK